MIATLSIAGLGSQQIPEILLREHDLVDAIQEWRQHSLPERKASSVHLITNVEGSVVCINLPFAPFEATIVRGEMPDADRACELLRQCLNFVGV